MGAGDIPAPFSCDANVGTDALVRPFRTPDECVRGYVTPVDFLSFLLASLSTRYKSR